MKHIYLYFKSFAWSNYNLRLKLIEADRIIGVSKFKLF